MQNEIEKAIIDIENKRNEINTEEILRKKEVEEFRDKIMSELVEFMNKYGVRVDRVEEIEGFLNKMEKINPDLRELFETAFNRLVKTNSENQNA